MGQGFLLALLGFGFRRLWHVGPTDQWPSVLSPTDRGAESAAERWVPWALRLAVITLAFPLMRNSDGLGFADWDFVLDKFEALRRTILIWGQFPWWNPWSRGGFPLAAEPQIGALSIATPLVITLGTSMGLQLSAVLCLLISVEGAYRLAHLWFREPWAAAATSLIYGLNGAVIISTSLGYILPMSYCSVPWLAYYAYRIGRRFSDGLSLGFWLAFGVMNGIQYSNLYAGPLTAMIWVRAFRVQPPGRRSALLLHTMAALGLFLLLCGWRLSTVLLVLLDDRRERVTYWDETPFTMLHYLLTRPPAELDRGLQRCDRLGLRRTDLLRRTSRPAARRLEPGFRLAMVAHHGDGLLLACDRIRSLVSAEFLARGLAFHRLGSRGDPLAIPGNARPGIRGR